MVLPNRGTEMMCQNIFGGKMIISISIYLSWVFMNGIYIKKILIILLPMRIFIKNYKINFIGKCKVML